jgi:hypothetical protein
MLSLNYVLSRMALASLYNATQVMFQFLVYREKNLRIPWSIFFQSSLY